MRFRKKPVVIEAVQWLGTNGDEVCTFTEGNYRWERLSLIIRTLEGEHLASPGDWIIKGVKGEFYPVKNEIFLLTYEPAPSPDSTGGEK